MAGLHDQIHCGNQLLLNVTTIRLCRYGRLLLLKEDIAAGIRLDFGKQSILTQERV
jgi:hypothetical protein